MASSSKYWQALWSCTQVHHPRSCAIHSDHHSSSLQYFLIFYPQLTGFWPCATVCLLYVNHVFDLDQYIWCYNALQSCFFHLWRWVCFFHLIYHWLKLLVIFQQIRHSQVIETSVHQQMSTESSLHWFSSHHRLYGTVFPPYTTCIMPLRPVPSIIVPIVPRRFLNMWKHPSISNSFQVATLWCIHDDLCRFPEQGELGVF